MKNLGSTLSDFDYVTTYGSRQNGFVNQTAPSGQNIQNLIKAVDITGDNVKDMIYPSLHNDSSQVQQIYAVDGKNYNHVLWTTNLTVIGDNVTVMELYDYNHDGITDVLVGTSSGYIYIVNTTNGALLSGFDTGITHINQMKVGNFNSADNVSIAIMTNTSLYLFDKSSHTIYPIDTLVANPNNPPGSYFSMVTTRIMNNNLNQLFTVTTHGISKVFDVSNASSPSVILTLNNQSFGQSGNTKQTKDFITSVASYDINGDGLDELFLAINSTIYAFDSSGTILWNKTDPTMSKNLDKLQVVHDPSTDKDMLLFASYPKLITFEDYNLSSGYIYNNYTSLGVTFGPQPWTFVNTTAFGGFYANAAHSGDYMVGGSFKTEYIEFNNSQQYVSFYLSTQDSDYIRVIGLDQSNKTVYVSSIYYSGVNQLVSIVLNKPDLKRIIFEGLEGFSNWLVIDNLEFGGTNIYALDPVTGEPIWQHQFYPTHSLALNPNVDANNNLMDSIVPLTFVMDTSFSAYSSTLFYNSAMYGFNLETGLPDFMTTSFSYGETLSGVSLGQGFYGFLMYYPYSYDHNNYYLYTYAKINSTFQTSLSYQVQNQANWQVNTKKFFTHIATGQLDPDQEQEMVVYNNRLIAAIDNNGDFLWKFVTSNDIVQILLAKVDNSGIDKVIVLLKDSTILTLDPALGIQLNTQTIPFFVPVKMLAVDLFANGTNYIVMGESNPGNTVGILIALKYQPTSQNFTISLKSTFFLGSFKDIFPMSLNNPSKPDGLLLYFDTGIVILDQNLTTVKYVVNSIKAVTVGDYNNDGKTDFAYINSSNYLVVQDQNLNYLSQRLVSTGLILLPGMKALYSLDLTGDGIPEIIQYQFGKGYAVWNATNDTEPALAYWQERSFLGGFLTDMDIDFDGHNELILRNERLVYAVKMSYNSYSKEYSLSTTWSSPLSTVPIVLATPVTLTPNTYHRQLVYLNVFGQLFAVDGISYPYTYINYDLRFNYNSASNPIRNIDTLSWKTSSWPSNFFDTLPDQVTDGNQVKNNDYTQTTVANQFTGTIVDPVMFFFLTFILGIATTVITKRKFHKKYSKDSQSMIGVNQATLGGNEL